MKRLDEVLKEHLIGYSNHILAVPGFLNVCWEVCKGCCLRDRHTWLPPGVVGTCPCVAKPQASSRQGW